MIKRKIFAVLLLNAPFMASASTSPVSQSEIINPCEEGEFLDLYSNQCKALDKNLGFTFKEFNEGYKDLVINVSNCKESSIRDAVEKIKSNGGGTVNLSECTYNITKTITLPSNIVFQGMGADKTILKLNSGNKLWRMVELGSKDKVKNIIIRDMKIQGAGSKSPNAFNISGDYANNVLLERLELAYPGRTAFGISHSQKITVRYSKIHHSAAMHAIGSKDCFLKINKDKNGDKVVDMKECSGGKAGYWTSNFSIYSNELSKNRMMGIDAHVSLLEVAGNKIVDNGYGIKFVEPATNLWIHDNYIRNNAKFGVVSRTQYCQFISDSMQVKNHVYYRNQLIDNDAPNGTSGFAATAAKNLIMVDNIYRDNGSNDTWNSNSNCPKTNPVKVLISTINLCKGDELLDSKQTGNGIVTKISGVRCDLAKVANIFGIEGDLNGDGVVNYKDVDLSKNYYGNKYSKKADLNFDGIVDAVDTALITQFMDASSAVADTGNAGTGSTGTGSTGTGSTGTGSTGTGSTGTGSAGTGSAGTGSAGTGSTSSTPAPAPGSTTSLTLKQILEKIEGLQNEQIKLLAQAQDLSK